MHFPCLQGIRMHRFTRKEQNIDVQSAKKKIQQPKKKFTALFKILF